MSNHGSKKAIDFRKTSGRDISWGWWEDLESTFSGDNRIIYLLDGDEVPDEHPEFDPSPPVHTDISLRGYYL